MPPVQVAFRVRPFLPDESENDRFGCIRVDRERSRVSVRNNDGTHHADFDRVFDEKSSQERVFDKVIAPLVSDFLSGRNCCVLAFGEKHSGKTYTMMGPLDDEQATGDDDQIEDDDRSGVSSMGSGGVSRQQVDHGSVGQLSFELPRQIVAGSGENGVFKSSRVDVREYHRRYLREMNEKSGIAPRIARELFSLLRKRRKRGDKDDPKLRLSFVEVHNEKIVDLLDRKHAVESAKKTPLQVRSSPDRGVYIEGVTEVACKSEEDILNALDKGLIIRRGRSSKLGMDNLSRSHAVVILKMERYSRSRGKMAVSNFCLVDLADSSLVKRPPEDLSDREYREYVKAHKATRTSLGALRKCIRMLAEGGKRSSPLGESTLTKLLHSSLSRGSAVSTIITVCPMSSHSQESLSSIRFGSYITGGKDGFEDAQTKDDRGRAQDRSRRSSKRLESESSKRASSESKGEARTKDHSGRGPDRSRSSSRRLESESSKRTLHTAKSEDLSSRSRRGRPLDRSQSSTRRMEDESSKRYESSKRSSRTSRTSHGDRSEDLSSQSQRGRALDRSHSSIRRTEKGSSKRSSLEGSRRKGRSQEGKLATTGSERSARKSLLELEAAEKVLERLNDHANEQSETDPIKELSHASKLLDSAAKRMQADLLGVKDELKSSDSQDSGSAADIRRQLLQVTKELESMQNDGQLASQIGNDLASARARSERTSQTQNASTSSLTIAKLPKKEKEANSSSGADVKAATVDTEEHGLPGSPVATTELERLMKELEDLTNQNESLSDSQGKKFGELETLEQKVEDSKQMIEDLEHRTFQKVGSFGYGGEKSTQKTSQTSSGTDTDGNGVSNHIATHYSLRAFEEEGIVHAQGRELPEEIQAGPCPITVCLRLRPLTQQEINRRGKPCITVHDGNREFTVDRKYDFTFDEVFDMDCSQEEVYETIGLSVVDHVIAGINCAVLVCGPSGSGKSYTLSGKEGPDDGEEISIHSFSESSETEDDASGLAQRLISDLFLTMRDSTGAFEHTISCSYICIYHERIFDLLDPRFDKNLVVRDSTNGVKIEGAAEAFCFVDEEVFDLVRRGAACRKLIASKLKTETNRSHSILTLNIEKRHIKTGKVRRSYLQLAELVGFDISKAKGQSAHESRASHKSFSVFASVIKSLSDGKSYAPYRESKLTSVLKNSLGGNCKTTVIVTASPSSTSASDTLTAIRLGERLGRVTNDLKVNVDATLEDYRKWLLHNEVILGEMSAYARQLGVDWDRACTKDSRLKQSLASETWGSVMAIAEEQDASSNSARRAILSEAVQDLSGEKRRWSCLAQETNRRLPSEKTGDTIRAYHRAQHMLKDIHSESIVLRRQNDLLVQEKRKKDDDLGSAHRENRKITLRNSELEHNLAIAEHSSKEAIAFLKYMRTLCWKLRDDCEGDRSIDIREITTALQGSSDLSGLIDLDAMLLETGFLQGKGSAMNHPDSDYFKYLQEAGLLIEEDQDADEEAEEGEEEEGASSRSKHHRTGIHAHEHMLDDGSKVTAATDTASYLGSMFGWGAPAPHKASEPDPHRDEVCLSYGHRNTRRERELHRDLQNMANRCVELQMELNEKETHLEDLIMKTTSAKMNTLAKESMFLAKERDRMLNNAKAATWKLQELHVVNKLLSKQSGEHKQQVKFLEDGIQRLQESFRGAVQDGLDTDQNLSERVKTLQGIVDSLAGPPSDDASDVSEESNPLKARVHLPVRGEND